MSLKVTGVHLKGDHYGTLAIKAAANLPQTATGTLFTVAGGLVLVHALIGKVTTALGATATTLSLGTSAAAATAIATATAVTSAALGTLLYPGTPTGPGTPAALVVAGGGVIFPSSQPFFADGAGNITATTNASDTGQVQWYCWYTPIDAGATVS